MVPRSTIYKQKRDFFALASVSSCLPLLSLTFSNTMLKYSKSGDVKCSNGMRRSNSSWFVCKRQQRPIMWSVQLKRQGGRQRPRQRKKLKDRGL